MSGNTRPQYETLRKRMERPLDLMVVMAALATVPIVVAQEMGRPEPWIALADWAVWAVFVLDFGLMFLAAADRARYCLRNFLGLAIVVLSFPSRCCPICSPRCASRASPGRRACSG